MPLSTVLGAQSLIKPGVCTTATRPASPYTGQAIYDTTLSQVLVYNGTAWAVVGATASGLVLISSTTIGTAVSSVTVSSAFSATYDNYKIIVSGGAASADNNMKMTLGSTATGYYYFLVYGSYSSNTVQGLAGSNLSSFEYVGGYEAGQLYANIDLTAPFLTKTTDIRSAVRYGVAYGTFTGVLANSTSYTAFTLTPASGNWTGGTVKVYGYANS